MPENFLPVQYTDRALLDSVTIKNFILIKFTRREVDNFYKMLGNFEKTVSVFPEIYPEGMTNRHIRRAVLSKQLSVFYQIANGGITVLAMIDNRMDYNKWP